MDRRQFIAAAVGAAVAKAEPKCASDTVTWKVSFDMASGPDKSFISIVTNENFVIHHVVVDGWFPWNAPAAMKHALESAKQGD
jgi:hypothetical protein